MAKAMNGGIPPMAAAASWSNFVPRQLARCFGVDYLALPDWQRMLWIIALIVCAFNIAASVNDYQAYGGQDLRIRVVGARLLLQGIDPYRWSSNPDGPAELQDPAQEFKDLGRCSYPPTLLLAYAPLTSLPYRMQRGIWMTLEWLALLTTISLAARLTRVQRIRFLIAVTGLFLVAGSYVWRFHVERGQYYVFIALMITSGVLLLMRRRGDHVGAGILFGLAMALRPPVAVLLLPLAWRGLRRTSLTAVLTAVVSVVLTLPWAGVSTWRNYTWMAGEWEKAMLDYSYLSRNYERTTPIKGVVDSYRPDALEVRGGTPTVGSVLARAYRGAPGYVPEIVMTPVFQKVCFLGVLALWFTGFILTHRTRPLSVRETMIAGVWLMVLTDYFLPMRVEYADVLFLLPMALAMPLLTRQRHRGALLLLILAWLPIVMAPAPTFYGYWGYQAMARAVLLLGVCGLPLFAAWRSRRLSIVNRPLIPVRLQLSPDGN
jgi:Glycosyltransferase family 87